MTYKMYLDGVLMPITPNKVDMSIANQNKTMNLINGEEINLLSSRGLTEISFDLTLPGTKYPFATEQQYHPADYYLQLLQRLKEGRKPFRWVWIRTDYRGRRLRCENMRVSLEDYSITDDAGEGLDITVSMELKEYKESSAKRINTSGEAAGGKGREQDNAPQGGSYVVQKGDSLWLIAKKQLGNGARYKEIYNLNKAIIKNPNLIYPGQRLTLP